MNPNDNSAGEPNWTCQRHARRARARDGEHQSATAGDWGPVYLSAVPGTAQAGGELLTFDLPAPSEARQAGDPETRLPAIDRLEGFHPGGSSMYRRVLVPAFTGETVVPVWLYMGDEIIKRRLAPLGKSRWL